METAKIFTNGGSQAVRLPKSCRFGNEETDLLVNRIGNVVIMIPRNDPWKGMMDSLDLFTDDFLAGGGISDLPLQERDSL